MPKKRGFAVKTGFPVCPKLTRRLTANGQMGCLGNTQHVVGNNFFIFTLKKRFGQAKGATEQGKTQCSIFFGEFYVPVCFVYAHRGL